MKPFVNILICTYNNKDIIDDVLKSVRSQTYRHYDCTIIDDHSSDDIASYIKKKFPWVRVIVKRKNSGPAEGRNLGIQLTKGKYIVALDSDVEIQANWLASMVEVMEIYPKAAIGGCKLIYARKKNVINSAGGTLTKTGIGKDIGKGDSIKTHTTTIDVLYACSAAMIIRRSALKKIGMFDAAYCYGHEDPDLGWRANVAGFTVRYNPSTIAYHRLNETVQRYSSGLAFHGVKNRIRSVLKNYEPWNAIKYVSLYGILLMGDIILHPYRKEKIYAVWWNVMHIADTLHERKKVQATRKKTDQQLFPLFDNALY